MIASEVSQTQLEDLHWALGILQGVAETTKNKEMRLRLERVDQLLRALILEEPVR
jgi:hypothetical protein